MTSYPQITMFPPLGQLSIIPPEQQEVLFTLTAEWNRVQPAHSFEFLLCYSNTAADQPTSKWASLPLTKSSSSPMLVPNEEFRLLVFTRTLSSDYLKQLESKDGLQHVSFTIRYRINADAPWQWAQTQAGTKNGELIFQNNSNASPLSLPTLKSDSDWKASKLENEHKDVALYLLESLSQIPKASSDEQLATQVLGQVPNQLRNFSIVRIKPHWIGPRHGKKHFRLAEDAIVCSFLTKSGHIVTFVAPSGMDDIYTVFRSDEEGQIVVAARNDGYTAAKFRVIAAVACNFEDSLAAAMAEVRKMVNQSSQVQEMINRNKQVLNYAAPDSALTEEWLDGLAYCTWNGIGQDLTDAKVLKALENLSNNGIMLSTLLIDDNWQTLGHSVYNYSNPFFRGWAGFEANKEGFPEGMKAFLAHVRQKHPEIRDIGVWHALFGYWAGIASDSELTKEYKTTRVNAGLIPNVAATITSIDATDLHRMYDDFYTWLSSCGVTFVKTDVQHMLDELKTSSDRAALTSTYQSAWTCAYLKHFQGKAISCMSQIPQIMFHSLLQTHTPRILLRNSDDFFPEEPESHPWHIWANAHNSLFTQHLNVLPDWDMFQTSHTFSAFHAAARCVSGGPILITDNPGEHDVALIEQMTAPSPEGRTITLRPAVGKTIGVFDDYNDGFVLKVGTETKTGVSLLGLFNVSGRPIPFLLSMTEFLNPEKKLGGKVLVGSHRTSKIYGPFRRDLGNAGSDPQHLFYDSLPVRGWDIYSAFPVSNVEMSSREISLCVLGLLGKMSGAAAVTRSSVNVTAEGKIKIKAALKALGKLGIWISESVSLDRVFVTLQEEVVPMENFNSVSLPRSSHDGPTGLDIAVPQILEIDIGSFWKARGLSKDCSSKEVEVEVLIG